MSKTEDRFDSKDISVIAFPNRCFQRSPGDERRIQENHERRLEDEKRARKIALISLPERVFCGTPIEEIYARYGMGPTGSSYDEPYLS